MPKVSIILTSYNHAKYLSEAIDSILAQTFQDYELIIWDDASTDNSWEIIQSYTDPRIRAHQNELTRRYAINRALTELASGEYIAIHHSDDIWAPEKLEKQVAHRDSHPEIGAVFTNTEAIGEDSLPLGIPGHFYSNIFDQPNRTRQEWLNRFFYEGNALCHPSVLIRRQCYDDCGLYRYGLAQLPDFDLWVRLCMRYEIHVLPEQLVRFRVHANEANSSGNRPEVRIRCSVEYNPILRNYLDIQTADELLEIFPLAKKYVVNESRPGNPHFMLAMLMLEEGMPSYHNQLGLEILFDLLADEREAENIQIAHGFDYLDLIQLTGKADVFSIEKVGELHQNLTQLRQSPSYRLGHLLLNPRELPLKIGGRLNRIVTKITRRLIPV